MKGSLFTLRSRMTAGLAVLGLAVLGWALVSAAPAAATPTGPVWIGAPNLNTAPDVNFDCTTDIIQTGTWPSCTWGNPLLSADPAVNGLDVPGTGTVYRVRLRIAGSTGRMELVILRTLYDPNDLANNQCCVDRAVTSAFTPVVNGITTLNVVLPVGLGYDAASNVDYLDSVGLSILEDGVLIPLVDQTTRPIDQRPVDTFNAPAMTLGENQKAGDPAGYMLDMQALWYPPGQSPAVVGLPPKTVTINGTTPDVAIDCSLAPCAGAIRIQNHPPGQAADTTNTTKPPIVVYANGSYSLATGKDGKVPTKLTSAGRTLAQHHTLKTVYVVVTLTNDRPAKTIVRSVTVRF